MKIREFYERTDGDFTGVIGRFLQEERVVRFVRMFPEDPSYRDLEKNLEEGRTEEAFRAVHTLKGVCMNLGFSVLYRSSYEVTEALRAEDLARAKAGMDALRRDYNGILEGIASLEG